MASTRRVNAAKSRLKAAKVEQFIAPLAQCG
jgi:hypothetical protein